MRLPRANFNVRQDAVLRVAGVTLKSATPHSQGVLKRIGNLENISCHKRTEDTLSAPAPASACASTIGYALHMCIFAGRSKRSNKCFQSLSYENNSHPPRLDKGQEEQRRHLVVAALGNPMLGLLAPGSSTPGNSAFSLSLGRGWLHFCLHGKAGFI